MEVFIEIIQFTGLLLANLAVGAVGFIPSVIITSVNFNVYDLAPGIVLSVLGEIFGALLGFYLFRWGFSKADPKWFRHRFWQALQSQSAKRVFLMIIALRLIPFVPSGLVTAGAALTPISAKLFMIASTIGKIPAVSLEIAVVYGFTQTVPVVYQAIILGIVGVVSVALWLRSKQKPAQEKAPSE
ncbi:MAG TPA: VTT domain-containing protein [Planococcus sp. (in: firmicutes)]|nr:VTT domain-containing protein [Planococcus sp. (in: firmicutes)]